MALPRTKGRVIMRTNYGDIDVELWPDQAPKAVRNFVQLCFEGFSLSLSLFLCVCVACMQCSLDVASASFPLCALFALLSLSSLCSLSLSLLQVSFSVFRSLLSLSLSCCCFSLSLPEVLSLFVPV